MMNELKVIESELVPVYETSTGEKVVYGTELHEALGVKSRFNDWIRNRLNDCESIENEDYETLTKNLVNGGQAKEYIIKLDTAKEMAMLERNDKGKQVRKYFVAIEKKYKTSVVNLKELSPELQMFSQIFNSVAQQQLEQKRQAEQINRIERTQTAIANTFQKMDDTEDFQRWANNCITKIAESPYFDKGTNRSMRYSMARKESYERLTQKRNCRLDDRVRKAVGRALEERPDIKKTELKKINKIYVIANDRDLRPAYELVLKEMMVCYYVKTA